MKTILGISLNLGLFAGAAHAFSLLGPYDAWMQPANGFRQPGDIGGPNNLGEEYRWNVPVVTYTFDQSFLDYFGFTGAAAVDQAVQFFNSLPPVSQFDPTNYPPESACVNYHAQALGLTELKSKTLSALLEQLGLAQPTRHTFCVHDFGFNNGNLVAQTVQRNFDPISFSPTNWVNDTAYNYFLQVATNGQFISVTAEEFPANPLDTFQPAVADGDLAEGEFYTGLTRDDVGGLRYLLRTNNSNLEILLPGVNGIGTNADAFVNQAVRRGVDKITFVWRDYDGLLGQFFAPYTNQFTDYYISNNTMVAQQLERVITEPDIVFSAGNGGQGIVTNAQIIRTGTSNWWNGATLPGANGPGLIRPPIKLTFSKPVQVYVTWDNMPNSAGGYWNYWGSFDGSTNPPVFFPLGAAATDLTLNLHLVRNDTVVGNVSWQIPLSPQESIVVLTLTNLVNWVPHLVLGAGQSVEWSHYCSDSRRFFRIVPNN